MKNAEGRRPPKSSSIVAWGVAGAIAVVLSYAFALALGLACLALPVVSFLVASADVGWLFAAALLGVFGLIVGCTILWALVPRRNPFEPPGVPIDLSRERRLATEIGLIAESLNEKPPDEVYLIPEANAFVAEPGGILGEGKYRVMGIGLPLLQTFTVAEFHALLAHEFAHFYCGDTRLAPWLYKARSAMVRVFRNLGQRSDILSALSRFVIVALPYMALMGGLRLYWKIFMRLTQLISRRQEFRSDEIACYLAGPSAFIAALQKINTCQAVQVEYWQKVVFPIAAHGYQPQIADSFARFLATPTTKKAASDFLEKQLGSTSSQPYDTHPPLGARIAKAKEFALTIAAGDSNAPSSSGQDLPAISLLDHLEIWETDLLQKLLPALKGAVLKPMTWETAGRDVYVPMWQREVAPFLSLLSPATLASLPELARNPKLLADRIPNPAGILLNAKQREERATGILSMALALRLIAGGWAIHVQPGLFFLQSNETKLVASNIVVGLKSGNLSGKDWLAFCVKNGISDWLLVGGTENAPAAATPAEDSQHQLYADA